MDVTTTVKDAAYVAVGLGVIAVQKAQVRRRELLAAVESQRGALADVDAAAALRSLAAKVEGRVEPVRDGLEARVELVLGEVEERVPAQARDLFKQVAETAKDAGAQLRERLSAKAAA